MDGNNCFFRWMGYLFLCTWFLTAVFILPVSGNAAQFPEPDPPVFDSFIDETKAPRSSHRASAATTEWTYHKSTDNKHPNGYEQQMLWLMNRARANPEQEGIWLATMDDVDVKNARDYFGVDLDLLKYEFSGYEAKPPAAFDIRLYYAAKNHSDDLIARDAQDHNDQFYRIDAQGFHYLRARGNVFSYTKNGVHGHAGFNIDWGGDNSTGMQTDRGHRQAIMALDGNYTNAGVAVVGEIDTSTTVGPLVTTGNYCEADTRWSNHFNRFLVGTVWQDLNTNNRYDSGEGIGSVTVWPGGGSYYAVTSDSGGYAIPILDAKTFTVTFSGNALSRNFTETVVVGSESVLLDLIYTGRTTAPYAVTGSSTLETTSSAVLGGTVTTNGTKTQYYFQYGLTSAYGSESNRYTTMVDGSVSILVTGLSPDTLYRYRMVATGNGITSFGNDNSFQTQESEESSGTDTNQNVNSPGSGGGCFIQSIIEPVDI